MLQDFDRWNEQKKLTHRSHYIPYFKPRDIWWIRLGKNISSESLGKGREFLRPVLIFQKFYGKSALIIPLTSQLKTGEYYFSFHDSNGVLQTALLPQIRYIDGKRFQHKISSVSDEVFCEIRESFFQLLKK